MSIYKSAINKPVTTILIFVAVIILGLFSFRSLQIDLFPKIDAPWVTIMTVYPGANGVEIETNVTKILENSLNSVEGVKEITSISRDNISIVALQFAWEADLTEALNNVRASVDMARRRLPDGAEQPIIFRFNTGMFPIMMYAITAEESYPGLERILEDNMVNVLKRVSGVGDLTIAGAPRRYIYVEIDPHRIDAFRLSVEQVGNAIASNNFNLASGSIKMGQSQYQLRVNSEFVESTEISDIVVATTPMGRQVFVRDVATVRDTIKDVTLDEKIMGKDGVRLIVRSQSDANTVRVIDDIKKEMEIIKQNLPPDIVITPIFDSSETIRNSIMGLTQAIFYALLFIIAVVFFFLGKWRATIIVALAIPISLIVSFIYLYMTGSSLNIISMSALVVAIGMVVDDAVVVLENISRHIEKGASPREASIYGTNEVWLPVVASTLVIIAVFMPLTMLGGQMGVLFTELGWIVSITVTTSTLVAISLTPMLSSRLLKVRQTTNGTKNWYDRTVIKWLDRVDENYGKLLHWCLNHKWKTIIFSFAFLILTILPFWPLKLIGTDFMPENDESQLMMTIELQQGTRLEKTMLTARNIEAMIEEFVPERVVYAVSTGADDAGGIGALFSNQSNDIITVNMRLVAISERNRSVFEIAEALRQELDKMPEIINYTVSTGGGFGGGGNNIAVEIYGYDFQETNALAQEFKERFQNIKGARDVNISRKDDRPELEIVFDKEKLARHGLSSQAVAVMVRNRINGMNAGYLKEDGNEYSIIVRLEERFRQSLSDIEKLTLVTPFGQQIRLIELAEIREYWAPPNVERKRRERIVTVSVTPVNISLGKLAEAIQAEVDQVEIPQGVLVEVGGAFKDMQEAFADMFLLLLVIILLVYIVMASQFESFAKPFIIMLSVPFAFSGVFLALWITGTSLSVIGMLGLILLVGIVVKNGIMLIDFTNLLRDRGYELSKAVAMAGASRLRPVLMTSLTTILGMVPLALSRSEGSETWVPMGVVVIGGATVSTLVTLLIVPVAYAVMSRSGERDKEAKVRKSFLFLDRPLPEADRIEIDGE